MRKSDVLRLLEAMPEEIDAEQLMYHLYVIRKVEIAEAEADAGKLIPQEEVEGEMDDWLRSWGPVRR